MSDVLEVAAVTIEHQNPPYGFSANDRCDRCGAQAYHLLRKGDRDLLFCNHDYIRHESVLLLAGWEVESDILALQKLRNPLAINA